MPFIGVRTNQVLTNEQKLKLAEDLTSAYATVNPQVSKFLQISIEDNIFINFKGNASIKSAFVHALVAPNTTEEDKEKIVKSFFPVLNECLNIQNENIYICISGEPSWGINNQYVNFGKA